MASASKQRFLERRYSPDGSLPSETPLEDLVVPMPVSVLKSFKLPAGLPRKPLSLAFLALLLEADAARRQIPDSKRALSVGRLRNLLRRGGRRAAVEACSPLANVAFEWKGRQHLLFSAAPALTSDSAFLMWTVAQEVRSHLERSFRLDVRRVEPFFRFEAGVLAAATTRWTIPFYGLLGAATVEARSRAAHDGWVRLEFASDDLAARLGWSGVQKKDFLPKVVRPALRDLEAGRALLGPAPQFLEVRTETTRGTLAVSTRRIGRSGTILDAEGVRERLRSARSNLRTVSTGTDALFVEEAPGGPLRQGFVW